ncbi:MAG: flagellar type III secretion system protein FliR [Leptospirales bacterium]|nr:flagellar type III secretion system protein FliR [Leptospirales bacterium]
MTYFVYNFQVFLLILVRMNSMFMVAPFFSSEIIPFRLKALLSFFIALIIFPVVTAQGYSIAISDNTGVYYLMILREICIGLYIGFLVSVVFAAFQLAGQFFAVQIGFGINEVLDPLSQISVPLIGQMKNLIALLVLLAMNGHHFMIGAVYRSYELVPLIDMERAADGKLLEYMLYAFSGMFVVAMKIALPVVGAIFLVSVSLGLLAKAAPQMNIMMMGFPFKIMVAFGILLISSPLIIRVMWVSLERTFSFISKVIQGWPT